MDLKPFTDAYEVVKELGKGIAAVAAIPQHERTRYREVLDDTFTLLDAALVLLIVRLGDLLNLAEGDDQAGFASEMKRLDNIDDWLGMERQLRLCSNLRAMSRELLGLEGALRGRIVIRDRDAFNRLVFGLLEGEGTLADSLGTVLQGLASQGTDAASSPEGFTRAVTSIRAAREQLQQTRRRLIREQTHTFEAL